VSVGVFTGSVGKFPEGRLAVDFPFDRAEYANRDLGGVIVGEAGQVSVGLIGEPSDSGVAVRVGGPPGTRGGANEAAPISAEGVYVGGVEVLGGLDGSRPAREQFRVMIGFGRAEGSIILNFSVLDFGFPALG